MRIALLDTIVKRVLLCDGAMGTMLQKAGLSHGDCPEEWNVSKSDAVLNVHQEYFNAGSDIVLTNTFGGNPLKLAKYGMQEKVEEFNRKGAQIARQAAGPDRYVLGDIGSCSELIEPYGDLSADQASQAFYEQAKALVSEDIDGLIIETMTDLEETKIALAAAKQATNLPIIVSLSYQTSRDCYRTLMGQKAVDCATALKEAGASVVGSNCGVGTLGMLEIIREIKSAETGLPLLAEPNAGLPIVQNGVTIYPETPEEMAAHVRTLVDLGVRILGGCCGTTPDHIAAFRRALNDIH